jgi:hypothetical protein
MAAKGDQGDAGDPRMTRQYFDAINLAIRRAEVRVAAKLAKRTMAASGVCPVRLGRDEDPDDEDEESDSEYDP